MRKVLATAVRVRRMVVFRIRSLFSGRAKQLICDVDAGAAGGDVAPAATVELAARASAGHAHQGRAASTCSSRPLLVTDRLGEGSYSTIWRVLELQPDGTTVQFVLKRMPLPDADDERMRESVLVEAEVLRRLEPHPCVLAFYSECHRRTEALRGQREVCLLLEYCPGGSLAGLIDNGQRKAGGILSGAVAVVSTAFQALVAVEHLHAQRPPLAHRDIKPDNLLLGSDGYWKLCDFGSARTQPFMYVGDDAERRTSMAALAVEEERIHRGSTPQYRAPEMCDLRQGGLVHTPADVWALGATLYRLLFCRDLFGSAQELRLGCLNFEPATQLSDEALEPQLSAAQLGRAKGLLLPALRGALTKSPRDRPTAAQLVNALRAATDRSLLTQGGGETGPSAGVGLHPAMPLLPLNLCATEALMRSPHHRSGWLTLRLSDARGLAPCGVMMSHPLHVYASLRSGGERRRTLNVRTDAAGDSGVSCTFEAQPPLSCRTHSLRTVELALWAASTALPDACIGVIELQLEVELQSTHRPFTSDPSWRVLQPPLHEAGGQKQARTSRRVSGEVSFALEWVPVDAVDAAG